MLRSRSTATPGTAMKLPTGFPRAWSSVRCFFSSQRSRSRVARSGTTVRCSTHGSVDIMWPEIVPSRAPPASVSRQVPPITVRVLLESRREPGRLASTADRTWRSRRRFPSRSARGMGRCLPAPVMPVESAKKSTFSRTVTPTSPASSRRHSGSRSSKWWAGTRAWYSATLRTSSSR
ncbi:MAG: hypothetical protein QM765_46545 [Myxococcales bacterium]